MRLVPVFLALAGLAGCAALSYPPEPGRVSLSTERLTVHFVDGSSCSADIAREPSGRFADCGQVMDYAVDIQRPSFVAGTPLEPLFEPYGTITLIRPADGRRWFWRTPQEDRTAGNPGPGQARSH
ncbi:hypothetical protein [Paenirhodobacter populi]|uniref:hypothetical protein n=1 Tax=Paenirhodobacter populi TaxID=2306993 RepID=UPI000FE3853B|nr:hypothetical protein [Sinirhodobacter populi]RWR09837.1 hypothetical protein D2T32_05715 [Sinirhodobacter populi]